MNPVFPTGVNAPHDASNHDPARTLEAAVGAAGRLAADLEQACTLTGDWSDAALTEALVEVAVSRSMQTLAATGCWGPDNRLPSGELWRVAGAWLETGWLQSRARFKPRGYAGDYELLHRICREEACDHRLGFAFDRYFQRQAAPQAVRARNRQIAAMLVGDCLGRAASKYRVVSVGAGAADDLFAAVTVLPAARRAGLEIVLLDLDPEALDFARQRLEPHVPSGAVHCVRENLARLASRPGAADVLAGADFLVCSGLFDYFDDRAAVEMLSTFWRHRAPGGLMLVGNFAPHNPTRAYMEWIGNWYLSYRTAGQLAGLAAAAEIPAERCSIASEASGVDLFLVAQ